MSIKNKSAVAVVRHYHFVIAIAIILLLLASEGWFLYRYFYQPFLATKSLIEFREQVALERLERSSYEEVKLFYEKRKSMPAVNAKTLRDPFTQSAAETALPPR